MLIKKIFAYSFYVICIMLLLLIIYVDIFSQTMVVNTKGKLIISATVIILVISATIIKTSYLKNIDEKIKAVKFSLLILFIFYLVNLLMLLFFDATYGRTTYYFEPNIDFITYFKARTNFIPFKGIAEIYELIKFYYINYGKLDLRYAIINIVGNLVAFAPMAFFIPIFFNRINNLKRFSILIICMTTSVELIQFITMTGTLDIDDVILNSFGAVIIYIITQIKILKSIFNKLYIIK